MDQTTSNDQTQGPEAVDTSKVTNQSADDRLLEPDELSSYREHWQEVQSRFVDQPEEAVKEADEMVGKLIERLSDIFDGQRASLEARWQNGSEADTEDLRVTMQRYRSFMDRLLAA